VKGCCHANLQQPIKHRVAIFFHTTVVASKEPIAVFLTLSTMFMLTVRFTLNNNSLHKQRILSKRSLSEPLIFSLNTLFKLKPSQTTAYIMIMQN
jgi:hypothetical protein